MKLFEISKALSCNVRLIEKIHIKCGACGYCKLCKDLTNIMNKHEVNPPKPPRITMDHVIQG